MVTIHPVFPGTVPYFKALSRIDQPSRIVPYFPNCPVMLKFLFLINNMWTSDKTQLKIETLKAMLITKCNFKETCSEFYDKIITKPHILKKIHGSGKYISM